MKLFIGSKNYSTWSMRPWVVLTQAGIPFEEKPLDFADPGFKAEVKRISPSSLVPVLVDGDLVVWDSLAIVEYLADRFADRNLWPADVAARAVARSLCCEMHAGFQTMRGALTMNFQLRLPGAGWNVKVQKDIDRIVAMWDDARARFGSGGPYLFGSFCIADAFFAPVAQRFLGYGVKLPAGAKAYVDTLAAMQAFQKWAESARKETSFYPPDEPYRLAPDVPPGDR